MQQRAVTRPGTPWAPILPKRGPTPASKYYAPGKELCQKPAPPTRRPWDLGHPAYKPATMTHNSTQQRASMSPGTLGALWSATTGHSLDHQWLTVSTQARQSTKQPGAGHVCQTAHSSQYATMQGPTVGPAYTGRNPWGNPRSYSSGGQRGVHCWDIRMFPIQHHFSKIRKCNKPTKYREMKTVH